MQTLHHEIHNEEEKNKSMKPWTSRLIEDASRPAFCCPILPVPSSSCLFPAPLLAAIPRFFFTESKPEAPTVEASPWNCLDPRLAKRPMYLSVACAATSSPSQLPLLCSMCSCSLPCEGFTGRFAAIHGRAFPFRQDLWMKQILIFTNKHGRSTSFLC